MQNMDYIGDGTQYGEFVSKLACISVGMYGRAGIHNAHLLKRSPFICPPGFEGYHLAQDGDSVSLMLGEEAVFTVSRSSAGDCILPEGASCRSLIEKATAACLPSDPENRENQERLHDACFGGDKENELYLVPGALRMKEGCYVLPEGFWDVLLPKGHYSGLVYVSQEKYDALVSDGFDVARACGPRTRPIPLLLRVGAPGQFLEQPQVENMRLGAVAREERKRFFRELEGVCDSIERQLGHYGRGEHLEFAESWYVSMRDPFCGTGFPALVDPVSHSSYVFPYDDGYNVCRCIMNDGDPLIDKVERGLDSAKVLSFVKERCLSRENLESCRKEFSVYRESIGKGIK